MPEPPFVASHEAVEHVLGVLSGHAAARVGDLELKPRRDGANGDGDVTPGIGVLVRVRQQVGEDPAHLRGIGQRPRQR